MIKRERMAFLHHNSSCSSHRMELRLSVHGLPVPPPLLPGFLQNKQVQVERPVYRKLLISSTSGEIPDACATSNEVNLSAQSLRRRDIMTMSTTLLAASFYGEGSALASEFADMPALRGKDYGKSRMRFPDYTITQSGLQYKDLRKGTGSTPTEGETVVVDWDGYTIGYYGRIFEARNKAKGGSFEGNEKDYLRVHLGAHEVIPAFEEAILTMNLGGIRRIIVPPELGYPGNDFNKQGPRPTTFSGQRALDFVLKNQGLIDKTLLFDIELLKIYPSEVIS